MAAAITPPMTALQGYSRRKDTGPYVGMVIFLSAFGMCFAALFFSYSVVRTGAMSWPPAGTEPLPLGLPALNTLVLALSSWTFHRAYVAARRGQPVVAWLGVTFCLGALFMALQLVVWVSVYRSGLHPSSGIYGSVFYALTVFHALHVVSALVTILYLLPGALVGRYGAANHTAVRLSAMFWHFVDVIWVAMFLSVYVF
ncbi:MAG: heme-copper oxidase subunit III [Myxococcales bacterium]|nr:heme-copper oxidase subunit III [Myxococcales bacterium]